MERLISYAQNGEDILLHRALHDVENGFYVDVGAWDPTIDSVTRHFYDRGWHGINIEPGGIFQKLAAERPGDVNLNVAASDHSGLVELYESAINTGISSIEIARVDLPEPEPGYADISGGEVEEINATRRPRTVGCLTLAEILDHYLGERAIDFLKIDVEGHEHQVIAGNDWQRFRPRIVVVEATHPLTTRPAWADWEPILLDAGYDFVFFDGLNRFYVRSESSDLKQYFNAPANVFDGFVSSGLHNAALLANRLDHLHSVISQASTRLSPAWAEGNGSTDPEADVHHVLDLANDLARANQGLALSKIDALESGNKLSALEQRLSRTQDELSAVEEASSRLQASLAQAEAMRQQLETEVAAARLQHEAEIAAARAALEISASEVTSAWSMHHNANLEILRLNAELANLRSQPGYQLLEAIRERSVRVAPWDSPRGRVVAAFARAAAYLGTTGLRPFLTRLPQFWKWLPKVFGWVPSAGVDGRQPAAVGPAAEEPGRSPAPEPMDAASSAMDHTAEAAQPQVLDYLYGNEAFDDTLGNETVGESPAKETLDERYARWLALNLPPGAEEQVDLRSAIEPRFSVVIPLSHVPEPGLAPLLRSIRHQACGDWEICIGANEAGSEWLESVLDAERFPRDRVTIAAVGDEGANLLALRALAGARGGFALLAAPGTELHPLLFAEATRLLDQEPGADCVYVDEDAVDGDGRHVQPFFKPGWSPEMLLSTNYLQDAALIRTALLRDLLADPCAEGVDWLYDLALRLAESTERVQHIELPLVSRLLLAAADVSAEQNTAQTRALEAALARRHIAARVEATPVPGWFHVHRQTTDRPLVSIVIPTRDKPELLAKCLDSIAASTYGNLEVIVVDNGSVERATHDLLASRPVTVVERDEPFNFSRLINAGVAASHGEYLVLLNNDVEALDVNWVEVMLAQASRPDVGAVGVRLLYHDGRPQHEGVGLVTLDGIPLRPRHLDWSNYLGYSYAIREVSTVTGACVMTRRSLFEDLGGLDEAFRVAYGDVDYCLALLKRGLKVLYTPYARLYHAEGASRGTITPELDERHAIARWGTFKDPYYTPGMDPVVAPHRVRKVWDDPLPSLLESNSDAVTLSPTLGVNVSGFFSSEKGVGEAVRAPLRALAAAEIPYVLNPMFDIGSANGVRASHSLTMDTPYSFNLACVNADVLPVFAADKPTSYFANHYNIGVWNWEFLEFPEQWLPYFAFFQEIWAPSAFIADCLARISPIPVVRMPYSMPTDHSLSPRISRGTFGLHDDQLVFLFVFDFHSFFERKNPLGVVRAFQTAFAGHDDVALILKCSRMDFDPAGAAKLRAAAEGWGNIKIIDDVLERAELNSLYEMCDAYVSLHRSEGFGFTIMEAMAFGKPAIATAYSGNVDFMTSENSYLVRSHPVEVKEDMGPYRKGWTWAEPDLDHAASLMRDVYENREEARARGRKALKLLEEDFSPAAVGKLMKNRLQRIASLRQK